MGKRERRRRREAGALAESPLVPAVPSVDTLRRLVARRDRLEQTITLEIDLLAGAGVGWPQIAAVLGVSRQAARQAAIRRRHPPTTGAASGTIRHLEVSAIDAEERANQEQGELLRGSWSWAQA
jgi:hypothetical protein